MNQIPDLVLTKTDCCGCGLCTIICPKNAIQLIEDTEGFLYPEIDKTICIICSRCKDACILKKRREEIRFN